MGRLLDHIHDAFHEPTARSFRVLSAAVWALIVASILIVIVDLAFREVGLEAPPWLNTIDSVVLILFGIEVVLRVLTHRPPGLEFFHHSSLGALRVHLVGRLLYCFKPLIFIDIITVVAVVPALRSLRILRLLRLIRTQGLFRYANPFEGTLRAFRDNAMLFGTGLVLIGTATLIGGTAFYLAEKGSNPGVRVLTDGFWWALVSLTTVGYGDLAPVTQTGRMLGSGLLVLGMFTLALFAGIVGHTLLHAVLSLREEQVRVSNFVNHIVVCGYDPGARMLLDAIELELGHLKKEIMIFAQGERPADLPPRFMWQIGDATKESELPKTRLTHADAVIIVGSRAVAPQLADAQTILTAFTIRSFLAGQPDTARRRRPLYLVSEILDAENVAHAKTAGSDEVIESNRLGFSLLAHAIVVHGTADILSKVVAAGAQNVYVGEVPQAIPTPLTFDALSASLKASHNVLVLGLRNLDTGADELNPPSDAVVDARVRVIYLAARAALDDGDQALGSG